MKNKQRKLSWPDLSSVSLILLTNLIPVVGVWIWGWEAGRIMFFYWLEILIIGLFTLLRYIVVGINLKNYKKLFSGGFVFCWVSAAFLLPLLAVISAVFMEDVNPFKFLPKNLIILGALGFSISHGSSFINNFIRKKKYKNFETIDQYFGKEVSTYLSRTVGIFLFILLGGFVFGTTLGSAEKPLFVIWILLITGTNLRGHLKEHNLKLP